MASFKPEVGKWYVSPPGARPSAASPVGGPFNSHQEAREWANCLVVVGAVIWKCYQPDCEPPAPEKT
jgi:hypothetical protein